MKTLKEYNQCKIKIPCSDCNSNTFCLSWKAFVIKHNKKKNYVHFDKSVSLSMPSIQKYVLNTKNISEHGFYPFIHFTKTISRYGRTTPKIRELHYCCHLDRCVYQRYSFLLNQKYNDFIKDSPINNSAVAYRDNLNKNNIDFAKTIFDYIKENEACLVIVGDFTDFFDNLDHNYLKNILCTLLSVKRLPQDYFAVYKNITQYSWWDWKLLVERTGLDIRTRGLRKILNQKEQILSKEDFKRYKKDIKKNTSGKGIPQGSPISAVLSNIYMLKLDKTFTEYSIAYSGLYMRYSDDFIVVLPYTNEEDAFSHKNYIFEQVRKIEGLDLQPEKTKSYIYSNNSFISLESKEEKNLDYLGFIFDGKKIKIRPKSITKYYYRMRRKARNIVNSNWTSPKGKHISAKELYRIYSKGKGKKGKGKKNQTFINYAETAQNKLSLEDNEAKALIKNHKHKIAQALKPVKKNK